MAKKMSDHIDSISRIKKLSACLTHPPFFYKWFGKPNLQEISSKLFAKYSSDTKQKYDKLIYTSETELNQNIKELTEKKKLETKNLNNKYLPIILFLLIIIIFSSFISINPPF